MKLIFSILFLQFIAFAKVEIDVTQIVQNNEQEQNYKTVIKNLNGKENKYYELKPIVLEVEPLEEECIEIEEIHFRGATIYSQEFLKKLTKNYLNTCNGIKKLNNLTYKITNMYIKKGYITSRAYLKMQDLSGGEVTIDIIEGKINKIKAKNLYVGNTFSSLEGKILNIRDLEVGVQEHERLKSSNVILKLFPSKKIGYTNILIYGKKTASPLNGKITLTKYTSKNLGNLQISSNISYDNPFNLNDIITVSFNTTNKAFDKDNNLKGYTINYGIPYLRNYFSFGYSGFSYKQNILNRDKNYVPIQGDTKQYHLAYKYKLYHDKNNKISFNLGYASKESVYYNNGILATLDTSNTNNISLSLLHSYIANNSNYYMNFTINKSTNKNVEENSQINFGLDIAYTTKPLIGYNITTSNLLHFLYTKKQKLGAGQINVGGNYSVRGFTNNGLSGYIGGFLRNTFSYANNISNLILAPYLGLDIGYISDTTEDVNPGMIIGSSLGMAFIYKKHSIKTYFNVPLKHTSETEKYKQTNTGISYEYKF